MPHDSPSTRPVKKRNITVAIVLLPLRWVKRQGGRPAARVHINPRASGYPSAHGRSRESSHLREVSPRSKALACPGVVTVTIRGTVMEPTALRRMLCGSAADIRSPVRIPRAANRTGLGLPLLYPVSVAMLTGSRRGCYFA